MNSRLITIDNPDDPMGMPAYEGTLADAGIRLDPGTYAGTDYATGAPIVVTVYETGVASIRLAD